MPRWCFSPPSLPYSSICRDPLRHKRAWGNGMLKRMVDADGKPRSQTTFRKGSLALTAQSSSAPCRSTAPLCGRQTLVEIWKSRCLENPQSIPPVQRSVTPHARSFQRGRGALGSPVWLGRGAVLSFFGRRLRKRLLRMPPSGCGYPVRDNTLLRAVLTAVVTKSIAAHVLWNGCAYQLWREWRGTVKGRRLTP